MAASCHEPSSAGQAEHPVTANRTMAVVGNPNCGKTTVFNALTGMRQKVGNYPGVTVEKKEGVIHTPSGESITLIDLPGMYSLTPRSPDEIIARDVLLGRREDTTPPEALIDIVDASNLERNLYLTTQLLELNAPTIVVLTMTDVAARNGRKVDEAALSARLGVPVTSVIVRKRAGLSTLCDKISALPARLDNPRPISYDLPKVVRDECDELCGLVKESRSTACANCAFAEAVNLLMTEGVSREESSRHAPHVLEHAQQDKENFKALNLDFPQVMVESRYAWIEQVVREVVRPVKPIPGLPFAPAVDTVMLAEKVDRVLLHQVWGYVIFIAVMMLVFQGVFAWAQAPTNWIGNGVDLLGRAIVAHMPTGELRDLVVQGILGGVGTTIEFLPQILVLFFFICLLEDTGYLARAAFLMDKVMSRVGLHGKSFIPLLSSFACAIPGIMATRTIDDRKSRLVTILIAPLMSCSARLPVYALMIGAFIPPTRVLGVFTLSGLTMISMYLLGTAAAFAMAWVFKNTLLKSDSPRFLMELPPYHMPSGRTILMQMLERSFLFLKRAGTIILTVSVVIWWLSSFPKMPGANEQMQLANSYAGRVGRVIEPAIEPLGFDWRIGVSLVSSFVAREVFVSSMGAIYSVGDRGGDPDSVGLKLQPALRADHRFSPLLAICVMIYYVLAMQCMSTIAVVKRETGGWKWPIFMVAYMSALAWIVTFIVWHAGRALGY
jgi:ferrous iron transport protein B